MKTRLNLFQHAFKAHKDDEPDGTVYASAAEAQAAAHETACEALGEYFDSDDTETVIEELARALETSEDDPILVELAEALEARPTGASPEPLFAAAFDHLQAVEAATVICSGFESAIYPTSVEVDTVSLLGAITLPLPMDGDVSVAAILVTGGVLAQQAADRWERGNLASTVQALELWAEELRAACPGLDFAADEDDDGDDDAEDGDDDRRAPITVAACDMLKGDLWIMRQGLAPVEVTGVVRLSPATVQIATDENEGTTYDLEASQDARVIR